MIKCPPLKLDGAGFKPRLCYVLYKLLCPSNYALTYKMELKHYVSQRAAVRT